MVEYKINLDFNKLIESLITFYYKLKNNDDIERISKLDEIIVGLRGIISSLESYGQRECLNLSQSIDYFKNELTMFEEERVRKIELLNLKSQSKHD